MLGLPILVIRDCEGKQTVQDPPSQSCSADSWSIKQPDDLTGGFTPHEEDNREIIDAYLTNGMTITEASR